MRKFGLLLLCLIVMNACGQSRVKQKSSGIPEMIAVLYELSKTQTINNFKHVNQEVAYKDGLWIESDRFSLWLVNYNNGIKEGPFCNYSLVSGKKALEGQYKNGILADTVTIYYADGKVNSVYKNIRARPNTLKITLEVASGQGDDFMFKETDITFEYEADFEKYSREGEVYMKGKGAFNDFKSYEIVNNKGFDQELSLFRIYELKQRE